MQAQQVGLGYAAPQARALGKTLALGLALLVALVLAGAIGFWVKGASVQTAAPAPAVTIAHAQAPDAADRNAATNAQDVDSQRYAAQVGAAHQQSPDAQYRNDAGPSGDGFVP
jgi:flagellar basal body-associated protein FliL